MENNTAELAQVELVDETQFFAPTDSDVIDSLLGRYRSERVKVEHVARAMNDPEFEGAVSYFLSGAEQDIRPHSSLTVAGLFKLDNAVTAMNRRYWSEALSLTDVYDCMPQARRDYWNAQIRGDKFTSSRFHSEPIPPLPDFEEATVRNTLGDLLRQRGTFFAERVDGIFRGLSGEHVTNAPEAFGKRMIVGYMLSYGSISHSKAGLINDLRCVIAKFMGRDEPKYNSSDVLVSQLYACTGQWVTVDGGTLRIRVYKKGTAHLEVHPDIAWRLNQVLASLYPLAIPAQFRSKPKARPKDWLMMGRPLPFATLELLASAIGRRRGGSAETTVQVPTVEKGRTAVHDDACNVLAALGGTPDKAGYYVTYTFDYPITEVLREVIITGCLPDQKAHQYYPTPSKLAQIAVDMADIGPGHTVLEPEAGQGGIADLLPQAQTTCIEIAPLHCAVLRAKGHAVIEFDFLHWRAGAFDRIVMNPPFSEGRAKLHTQHAYSLLKPGGVLVAILPASYWGKDIVPNAEWSSAYDNEFAGTSVSVVLLKATK